MSFCSQLISSLRGQAARSHGERPLPPDQRQRTDKRETVTPPLLCVLFFL